MRSKQFLLITFFSAAINGIFGTDSVESIHYKLAVGQGECSTTISTIHLNKSTFFKVAVTADIGSSSLKSDSKYVSCYDLSSFQPVFKKKHKKVAAISQSTKRALSDPEPDPVTQPMRAQPTPMRAQPTPAVNSGLFNTEGIRAASLAGDSSLKGSWTFLIEQLKAVSYWFVILSHPDNDHINELKSTFDALYEKNNEIKLIYILGGELYNPFSTQGTRDLISLLKHEKSVMAFLPFEDAKLPSEEITKLMQSDQNTVNSNAASFNPKRKVNNVDLEDFHGTLYKCLTTVYSDKEDSFWKLLNLDTDTLKKKALIDVILEKIYIWSLDYRPANENARSLVWSHAVDDIGWTFVYTGDAEKSTFEKIKRSLSTFEGGRVSDTNVFRTRQPYHNLVMMQCMHHGSKENVSELAIAIFQPNVFSISAGNGAVFAHPHMESIKKYGTNSSQHPREFWAKYELEDKDYTFSAFSEPGQGVGGKAFAISPQDKGSVFLCPNNYGTIKITSSAISIPFNTAQPGYYRYSLLHAYEQIKSHIVDLKTITVDGLIKKYDKKDEEYWQEPFWEQLKGKVLTKSKKDSSLYEDKHDAPFKLQMFTKIRDRQEYCFFYVLRKLSAEDNVILPVDTGIVPAEED